MSRNRRIPLFEVMRETNPRLPVASSPPRRADAGSAQSDRSAPVQVFPRITTPEQVAAASSAPAAPSPGSSSSSSLDSSDPGPARPARPGVFLSYPGLAIAVALVVLVTVLIAVTSYRSGVQDERNQLLALRDQAPPHESGIDGLGGNPPNSPDRVDPPRPAPQAGDPDRPAPAKTPPAPPLPVLGEDPRVRGSNYLIVATLFRTDAQNAAQYLTDAGLPCVVVAPEGKSPDALLQDRRANWLVIARQGFTTEEYKSPAAISARSELERRVKQIGRRWKQDKKGTSDFADCFWDKFGR